MREYTQRPMSLDQRGLWRTLIQRLRGEETQQTTYLVLGGGLYWTLWTIQIVLIPQSRRCPGANLVDSSNWLLIASIIATMNITKAIDEKGKTIEPEYVFENLVFRSVVYIYQVLCNSLRGMLFFQDTESIQVWHKTPLGEGARAD